jgi:hypothetical protein
MKIFNRFLSRFYIILLAMFMLTASVHAAHRAMLFNQNAMDKVLEMWPYLVESVNNQARGMEGAGERGIITQSPLRAHLAQLLREQPTPAQYGDGFKMLVEEEYAPKGMTTFGSRLNTSAQISAYHYMLREENRLPLRFAYSLDLARQAIPEAAANGFYEHRGAMWDTIESNPWLWLHGMSAEGDWDAPNRGCMGDDLPVKRGVDAKKVKEVLEICPDFNAPTVNALMRGVRSGWRFAGVHSIGSHAIRLFVQKLEEHMKANPKVLTMEFVRESRHGFAHGTMTGAVQDVVEAAVKYNLYIPIALGRSLEIEPDNCRQNYVEACFDFLGPIKKLLDAGVNVVGESHEPTYFGDMDIFVNRTLLRGAHEGETFTPEQGVDRIVALKLFTFRSAEFLYGESKVGSLEIGKYADFIVTDKPFLSGPDREIHDNKVVLNVLAGQSIYQDPEYNPVSP